MNHYVTTYQKDFVWPDAKTVTIRPPPKQVTDMQPRSSDCICVEKSEKAKLSKEPAASSMGESHDWSRIGPMAPLLDPKLYPAKTGPSPETEASKFDQPRTYLKKLKEKYPDLYGVLESASPNETIRIVEDDRMKTTYQTDYGGSERITKDGENLVATANVAGEAQLNTCLANEPSAKTGCPPHTRPALSKSKKSNGEQFGSDRRNGKQKCGRKAEDGDGRETRLPAWKSEYQDNIGKIGGTILKLDMHHVKKKKAPVWAMAT